MNGVAVHPAQPNASSAKTVKPPPSGPTPPAPPTNAPPAAPNTNRPIAPTQHNHPPAVNGTTQHPNGRGKKKPDVPVDPGTMYESLKNRIAALEEEEVIDAEDERRFAEEAQKSIKGLEENTIHAKYIELFAEFKRLERDHAKEKQKLTKDKDAAKSQLTKANQSKSKMENLARELQKDNKRLKEDGKRLSQNVEEAQGELRQMKNAITSQAEKSKRQDVKYRDFPDIVVKVVCRYRAELFFRISRKTKLSRLFNAWTERMDKSGGKMGTGVTETAGPTKAEASPQPESAMQFIFTQNGRVLEAEQTPEDAGMEDQDEILAVEMMDLTEDVAGEEWEKYVEPHRPSIVKNWTDDPQEAKRSLEDIFDGVVRERLKEVLRQYELRERHFECLIRSKELEVLLSRARAAEQKQLVEGEKSRIDKQEDEINQLRKDLGDAQNSQTLLIEKLIQCCREIRNDKPNAEKTQRLFASLREELEKRVPKGGLQHNEIKQDGSLGS